MTESPDVGGWTVGEELSQPTAAVARRLRLSCCDPGRGERAGLALARGDSRVDGGPRVIRGERRGTYAEVHPRGVGQLPPRQVFRQDSRGDGAGGGGRRL